MSKSFSIRFCLKLAGAAQESIASFLFHIAFIKINVPLDIIINDNLIYQRMMKRRVSYGIGRDCNEPCSAEDFSVFFVLHETGTDKEIRKALPDIPIASLYRHIKILADSSILMVVGENRIRGTVESVYQLNEVQCSDIMEENYEN